ncbi:MAG TPA: HemK family protein methyltransferase, partial [Thermoanaerobaculia bacterium]
GTGSGCIAISIERERPDLRVLGIDVSVGALALAAANRARLQSNVRLAGSDVLTAVRGQFDLVVTNPPYIAQREVATLQTEVRDHEPMMALTPGPIGTEVIERILDDARRVLRPDGVVIMEIGFGQEASLRELAAAKNYRIERFIDDLAGIARVIVLSA